jgi:hypothetical protein
LVIISIHILIGFEEEIAEARSFEEFGGFWRFWFLLWDFALVSGFWWASGPVLEKFFV